MKRTMLLATTVVMIVALTVGVSTAMAAKPQNAGKDGTNDVIDRSNGFPSGPHYNLNLHFKNWETCPPDLDDGGHSIFLPMDEIATIQYVSNKKSSVTDLTAVDACGIDGTARVQLPAIPNGVPAEERGYFVFGRILASPNKGSCTEGVDCPQPSTVTLDPAVVLQACNDPGDDPNFGTYTDCLLALGLIIDNSLYVPATPETYERFVPGTTQKRGKSKATDITRLFTWSGWVYDASLDSLTEDTDSDGIPDSGDGVIDKKDVPLDPWDADSSGTIDDGEFNAWRDTQVAAGLAWYYSDRWILDIADIVLAGQDVTSDGGKLLQIRFYPMWTTEYIPPTPTP